MKKKIDSRNRRRVKTTSLRDLADGILKSFPADPDMRRTFRAILVLLAQGRPVRLPELEAVLGWPRTRVEEAVGRIHNRELDPEGSIVGAGLSLRETPHGFEVDGRRLFTWCALDALMFPAIIGKEARVTSPCAATGASVRLVAALEGVREVDPPDAVVSIVVPDASPDIRGVFCCHVNFYSSRNAAERWLAAHPSGHLLSVAEAYEMGMEIGRAYFGAEAPERG